MDYVHKEQLIEDRHDEGTSSGSGWKDFFQIQKRYIIYVLLFSGMVVVNAQRVNIGVTVVSILDRAPQTKVGSADAVAGVSLAPQYLILHIITH